MIRTLERLGEVLASRMKTRNKRWEEFRDFHREVVETIDPEVAKEIGHISKVCKNHDKWSVVFNKKDYLWWGLQDKEKCNIIPLNQIKRKVMNRVADIVDKMEGDVSMEEVNSILHLMEMEEV